MKNSSYLCTHKANDIMKKIRDFAGLLLIILGTLMLVMTRIPALVSSNALLLTGLLLIVAGIWLHIRSIKKESRY